MEIIERCEVLPSLKKFFSSPKSVDLVSLFAGYYSVRAEILLQKKKRNNTDIYAKATDNDKFALRAASPHS